MVGVYDGLCLPPNPTYAKPSLVKSKKMHSKKNIKSRDDPFLFCGDWSICGRWLGLGQSDGNGYLDRVICFR